MCYIADGKARVNAGFIHMIKHAAKASFAMNHIKRIGEKHILGNKII